MKDVRGVYKHIIEKEQGQNTWSGMIVKQLWPLLQSRLLELENITSYAFLLKANTIEERTVYNLLTTYVICPAD